MHACRYPPWVRHLHWLVFALLADALTLIHPHGAAVKDAEPRANLKWAHMQFGVAVLLLALPRIVVRVHGGKATPIAPPILRPASRA